MLFDHFTEAKRQKTEQNNLTILKYILQYYDQYNKIRSSLSLPSVQSPELLLPIYLQHVKMKSYIIYCN